MTRKWVNPGFARVRRTQNHVWLEELAKAILHFSRIPTWAPSILRATRERRRILRQRVQEKIV